MILKNIKKVYAEIFKSYENPVIEEHIKKIIELDGYLPYNSTFFCITNTQTLSFDYISKNMFSCVGLKSNSLKKRGMRSFWSRIHPEDVDYSLSLKLQIVNPIEKGKRTTTQAQRKYGVQSRSTIVNWPRKYGNFDWENQTPSNIQKPPEQKLLYQVQKL